EAERNGRVSTLVVPADLQQRTAPGPPAGEPARDAPRRRVDTDAVERVAREVRAAAGQVIFILGGDGLSRAAQHAAGRAAAAAGAVLYSETFPARAERGGGLPPVDRLPYFPEAAVQVLRSATLVVLAGAREPVAYFGYEGLPSRLARTETVRRLAGPGDDAEQALVMLAELIGASEAHGSERAPAPPWPAGCRSTRLSPSRAAPAAIPSSRRRRPHLRTRCSPTPAARSARDCRPRSVPPSRPPNAPSSPSSPTAAACTRRRHCGPWPANRPTSSCSSPPTAPTTCCAPNCPATRRRRPQRVRRPCG